MQKLAMATTKPAVTVAYENADKFTTGANTEVATTILAISYKNRARLSRCFCVLINGTTPLDTRPEVQVTRRGINSTNPA